LERLNLLFAVLREVVIGVGDVGLRMFFFVGSAARDEIIKRKVAKQPKLITPRPSQMMTEPLGILQWLFEVMLRTSE
jgi:hypothetical protein